MAVLDVTRAGATVVLTMNRPVSRNALDHAMRAAFAEAIADIRDDSCVRAVVLTGAGGHFCAGGDLKGIAEDGKDIRDIFDGRQRIREIHRWFDELVDLEKPVIAAVDGVAFGAGLSLALSADFIVASVRARFCAAFVRMGFVPDAGAMYLLPRQVGLTRAKELVFSGRVVEANEAIEIGLAYAVSQGDVLEDALLLASRFHEGPTEAIGIAKCVMNRAFESDRRSVYAQEAMAQALCRESAFHQEAVQRFVEKKPALYQWQLD